MAYSSSSINVARTSYAKPSDFVNHKIAKDADLSHGFESR